MDLRDTICPLAPYDGREPFADTYLALEGEHPTLRFARAHCASWEESPAGIGEGERIVGIPRPHRVVESTISSGLAFDRALCERLLAQGDERQRQKMERLLACFPGQQVTADLIRDEVLRRGVACHPSLGNGASFQGHMVIDYAKILRLGIAGLRREVEQARAAGETPDQDIFYHAMLLYAQLYTSLCRRYAAHALTPREGSVPSERGAELQEIAAICTRVAQEPPCTFRQALQLYWFAFLLDGHDDPGRLDQLLHPFYRDDLAAGRLSRGQAEALLTELWLKMEQVRAWSLVLGGQTAEGSDASNDLTTLSLEVTSRLRLTNPAVALRVHAHTSPAIWRLAMRSIARGGGMPSLVNDDAVIAALVRSGVALGDARDYAMGGCIEFQIAGKSNHGGEDGQINLAKCLELSLNDGCCALSGELLGPRTGDPRTFGRFDDLLGAYRRQVEEAIGKIVTQSNIGQEIKSRQGAKLFRSLLLDDCIARGRDCEGGGARYGNGQILTNGIVVVADSLAAVKTALYDERWVSMDGLLCALRANWQGHEELRQRILHRAPRYGNGDPAADDLAHAVSEHVWSLLTRYRTHRGGAYTGLLVYFTRQVHFGRQTAATPDGRFDRDVLEDSAGPWPGRDTHGPTAMFRSAARIAQELAAGGVVLNLKLTPGCVRSDEDQQKTVDLVRTYFGLGGQQVQVTVADAEDLRAAMREPEKWRQLIVRVGGYSDYYVTLDRQLQESILQRTEYASAAP